MRLPQLHDALVQAAEAQEASQQRGSRPRKRAVLLGSLATALLCAAGAAAVLYAGDSKPLVGNLAQGPNGRASKYTIQVFPMMTAGWAGWCTVAVFAEGSSTRTTVYGCGKSTLLQIVSGILQPTTGRVVTRGRIAALLELGAGFNPEFSGRENVYLNGEIMGLS